MFPQKPKIVHSPEIKAVTRSTGCGTVCNKKKEPFEQ